ncbi:TetR/AcrR family transcriptional regulator [Cytobacillus sp. FSL R5-0569]|uniref:TetR/AcrR family transcriptional regulator n=1 Tax=Cytobacillus sp. FSL R5-0569 TaxID=2921649 RepID=UPI0030FA2442
MSNSKKEDPRTIRTKEMFKKSVLSLIGEEGYTISNLTVQKVAGKAGLNRTTFYLHYLDIEDLLTQVTQELVNDLSSRIFSLIQVKDLTEKQQLTQLLDFLYIHRNYLQTLFNLNQFEDQLFLQIRKLIEVRRENTEKDLPDDYVSIEIKTASLVGIIMWWIRKGIHYSSEYISDQIYLMYKV